MLGESNAIVSSASNGRLEKRTSAAPKPSAPRSPRRRVRLAHCADALRQMGDVMAELSTALPKATAREDAAMTAYITSLEAAVSRQRELS